MNDSPDRATVVFDGDCSFCRVWIEYWQQRTGGRVEYIAFQDIGDRFPDFPREDFASAVQLFLPSGELCSGAHVVFSLLALLPGKSWMLWMYQHVPGFALIAECAYRIVARHRDFGYWATRAFWGIPVQVETFRLASWLFLRMLGLIYLIAFWSFGVQAAGLIGSHGISPVAEFLRSVREYYGAGVGQVPTLFWLNAGDGTIKAVWIAGVCLSAALLLGVRWRIVRIALFVLYLSLVTAGQEFMGYQWDALLLEAGFLAILLGSSPIVVWLYRWLLFRLVFLSGVVKLASGDPTWRHFTALPVHYETQPLPTPLAWYMYQLPGWFQRGSVGIVFFVELIVPFFIFAPRRARLAAAGAMVFLQVLILLTGNYAFFNLLTISFCLFLMDDALLGRVMPARFRPSAAKAGVESGPVTARRDVASYVSTGSTRGVRVAESGYGRRVFARAVCRSFAALALLVGGFQVARPFGVRWAPAEFVTQVVSPFQVINSDRLFAVMTTTRPEIVSEGSNDVVNWLPYEFKYKPGNLSRRPTWVAPHQPRLDWQMWFAALGSYQSDPWIIRFMARLLEGSPEVLELLRGNPFPERPPRYVRAMLYEYHFASAAERKGSGAWWRSELKGVYVPAVSLKE
jgi:predicted DCC family thiol-disulfide oxidoreductase YuxK